MWLVKLFERLKNSLIEAWIDVNVDAGREYWFNVKAPSLTPYLIDKVLSPGKNAYFNTVVKFHHTLCTLFQEKAAGIRMQVKVSKHWAIFGYRIRTAKTNAILLLSVEPLKNEAAQIYEMFKEIHDVYPLSQEEITLSNALDVADQELLELMLLVWPKDAVDASKIPIRRFTGAKDNMEKYGIVFSLLPVDELGNINVVACLIFGDAARH